jgi:DNA gyrase subunit A
MVPQPAQLRFTEEVRPLEIGTVRPIAIEETMRSAYLDYAMSVIVSRALPDARDGLKPVHRRILYAVYDMGLRHNTPHRKSARIVGEVLGKYHPHGDSAVYDAMARMAQDFSMRYPLVDGQGNFGSVDGDSPAAMRYTEARLTQIAEEMLGDIEKDTVDLVDNFDGSLQEPSVLTSRLPNLLLNGTSGIAVGMATNIAPHNLSELCDAIGHLIERYAERDEVQAEDLMQFVRGPDFPTGGLIVGSDGIVNAYATGKGKITMRAVTHIEEMRGNRQRIVVTELPYQVNKANLVERIATLVREERIEDITDLRDESDRRGMSIIIELKRSADPTQVLEQLLKHTQLQSTFGYNCLALVDGAPRTLSLKQALLVYIEHRREVIVRQSRFELERARTRAHILEGLRLALDHLDAVIATIRESNDADTARTNLMERFDLSEAQAQAILDMQLRRLAALERQKIEDEYAEVIQRIAYLEDLLANPRKILYLIHQDVIELKHKYGDTRRTHIVDGDDRPKYAGGLVPDLQVRVSVTRQGQIKRTPLQAYRLPGGGAGPAPSAQGVEVRDPDPVLQSFTAGTQSSALVCTSSGRVYEEKVYQIPEGDCGDPGLPLRNLVRLDDDERVIAVLPVPPLAEKTYLTMFTVQGKIKRALLSEFADARAGGVSAINLDAGDELGWALSTDGKRELLVTTARGQALRLAESEVLPKGAAAGGILGIRLAEGDDVVSVRAVEEDGEVLITTANGVAKRTAMAEYPAQGRNTQGVIALHHRYLDTTGPVVSGLVVRPEDGITFITAKGMALYTDVTAIPQSGRTTRGQVVINLEHDDRIIAVARREAEGPEQTPA